MYIITQHQISLIEESRREFLVEKLFQKFIKTKPTYLPANDSEIRILINKKIIESKKWELENDELIEKYIYLCLSYKKMMEKELPNKYVVILTWPSRSGEDKLQYLHDSLIKDHYVIKPK